MDLRIRRLVSAILIATAGSLTVACGGSTATNEGAATSQAQSGLSTTAKPTSPSSPHQTQDTAIDSADQGAREVESIPEVRPTYEKDEQSYLDNLAGKGIQVTDIESQLLSTGRAVCSDDQINNAAPAAVAGQLVVQKRTKHNEKDTAAVIEEAARAAFCPA